MGCRDNDERGKSGKWGALAVVITGTEACACLDIRVPKQSGRGRGGEGASQRELWRERQKVTSVKDCHYHPIISDYVNIVWTSDYPSRVGLVHFRTSTKSENVNDRDTCGCQKGSEDRFWASALEGGERGRERRETNQDSVRQRRS